MYNIIRESLKYVKEVVSFMDFEGDDGKSTF